MYMEKEQKKNETKEKKPLTEQQRLQRKKMLVYPLMGLLFLGCMWLIFAPSSEDREKAKQGQGFNTDMPLPEDSKIIGDKAKAYEQLQLENRQKERRGMVGDLSSFWHDGARKKPDTAAASDDYRLTQTEPSENERADKQQGGHTHLRCRLRAAEHFAGHVLRAAEGGPGKGGASGTHRRTGSHADGAGGQAVLNGGTGRAPWKRSYELAARYQNGKGNAGQTAQPEGTETSAKADERSMKAEPVSGVRPAVVSALPQPMTDSAFIADYAGERNYGFHTAIGTAEASEKNTIAACVQGDQTLTDGQTVKLRLLEPMRVSGRIIPRNTLLVGAARLQGERLGIGITLAGIRGKHHPGRTGGVRQRRAGGHLHPRLDGDRRGKGNRGEHGSSARQQHQHIDRRGGAARLRLGARGDTGHLAVHLEEDAHGQGASEIGVQGAAVPRKGMNSPKI